MDAITTIIVVTLFYSIMMAFCIAWVASLRDSNVISTRKWEARWLLLCIVWPIIPVIGAFWIVGVIVFWLWGSFANLIHDAQLGKRD